MKLSSVVTREVEFAVPDGREDDDERSGVNFVSISNIFVMQDTYFIETKTIDTV